MKSDLIAWSTFLKAVRHFFDDRSVIEVTTQPLSHYGNPDPYVDPLKTSSGFLHTSPEFEMKQLLAKGAPDCYQICHVFRQEEQGPWHQEAFLMLEWYRIDWGMHQLIHEVLNLVQLIVGQKTIIWVKYPELFSSYLSIDITTISLGRLREICKMHHMDAMEWTRNDCLFALQACVIEPQLTGITVVTEYPQDQASLAKVASEGHALRFEVYIDHLEIANGFEELTDENIQRHRFTEQNAMRLKMGKPCIPLDDSFLNALKHMPQCSGVALGLERLFAIQQGRQSL